MSPFIFLPNKLTKKLYNFSINFQKKHFYGIFLIFLSIVLTPILHITILSYLFLLSLIVCLFGYIF